MKKRLITTCLALVLAWLFLQSIPVGQAEGLPQEGLDFSGQVEALLPLSGGRMVYVPRPESQEPFDPYCLHELRCVSARGELLWACELPPFQLTWGGLYQREEGGFALVVSREKEPPAVYFISREGELTSILPLPDGLKPIMLAGDFAYATRWEKQPQLFRIDFSGRAQPLALPGLPNQQVVLWSVSRPEGDLLFTRSPYTKEKNLKDRQADHAVSLFKKDGSLVASALVQHAKGYSVFGWDAALNEHGGLTAILSLDQPEHDHQKQLACFDAEGSLRWRRTYSSLVHSLTFRLIDRTDTGYVVYGNGHISPGDAQPFAFRLTLNTNGDIISTRVVEGAGLPRRHPDGGVLLYNLYPDTPSLRPFEAHPTIDLVIQAD